ncbi:MULTISPECIES: hypothetical protein [unclassified Arthrobacter]|uniref:hypothetical protein n=1 Tax=unclassified Arthrobacter TaxID=235627 RepID=UPI0006DA50FA|nr:MULTISPECIES: hypothetical protein [unclassified Arthrobacter]KPN18568.1 hypothetical protein AO716_12310 [Arthrobacter sp. Edens01]MSR97654.1 hypothetical protein [Arthrobacter sp. BL-252-APC-1A]
MEILRMYKQDPPRGMLFREAVYEPEDGSLMVTKGRVGHEGTVSIRENVDSTDSQRLLKEFAEAGAGEGFAEIPEDQHHWVIAQYALKSKDGTERDRYLEHKASTAIGTYFAWRGLGSVEESGFSPYKLNILCLVPDVKLAVKGIQVAIRESRLDFTKLSIGSAPFADLEHPVRRYPLPSRVPFEL